MRLFGRRRPSALDRLTGAGWTCSQCRDVHKGMFDLGAAAPDHWSGPRDHEPNGGLRLDGDFLSEDFCVTDGEHYFIRCVFEIPVHGIAERFGFGAWSTLSRTNFDAYVDQFDVSRPSGPWTGWFSNRLLTFEDTLNQPCRVHPQLDRQRPVLSLMNADHELARAQSEGITPERLLEIYAAYGHAIAD